MVPLGVTVVIVHPQGYVVGHGSDFNKSGAGGFNLAEIQAMRARRAAWKGASKGFCGDDFAEAIMSGYAFDTIRDYLLKNKKYTEVEIRHGHEEEAEE